MVLPVPISHKRRDFCISVLHVILLKNNWKLVVLTKHTNRPVCLLDADRESMSAQHTEYGFEAGFL